MPIMIPDGRGGFFRVFPRGQRPPVPRGFVTTNEGGTMAKRRKKHRRKKHHRKPTHHRKRPHRRRRKVAKLSARDRELAKKLGLLKR